MSRVKRSEVISKCEKCGMQQIYLSWSRLRSHEECKQKGYLRRVGKKPEVSDHRNFLPGNITDRIVRDWLLDDPADNQGAMPEMVFEYFQKSLQDVKEQDAIVKWKGHDDKNKIFEQCKEAVTTIEPYLNKFVVPYEYTPDFKFEVPIEVELVNHEPVQVVLNGYMDILVKYDPESYGIFDVKHTTNNDYWRKTIGQLGFYDTATFLLTGHYSKIAALMQPLCINHMKPSKIQEVDRQKMWQSITSYAQDFVDGNREPTNKISECHFCEVKFACERFQPKMKKGKAVISL